MAEEQKRWRNRSSPALAFAIWFFGWLFTIGYVGMVWWQIILAIHSSLAILSRQNTGLTN